MAGEGLKLLINTITVAALIACTATAILAETTRHLGRQPSTFGTQAQSLALLALMREQPGDNRYQIDYTTEIDAVVVGCDLSNQTLARIHNRPDGHGTAEKWSGHVLYRLQQGVDGESLNTTPQGKSPASYQSF